MFQVDKVEDLLFVHLDHLHLLLYQGNSTQEDMNFEQAQEFHLEALHFHHNLFQEDMAYWQSYHLRMWYCCHSNNLANSRDKQRKIVLVGNIFRFHIRWELPFQSLGMSNHRDIQDRHDQDNQDQGNLGIPYLR